MFRFQRRVPAFIYFMNNTRIPIGKTTRFNVFKRDSFTCQYCGSTPPSVVLEIDHMVPVSKGGTNDKSNLLTACFDCNRGKRDVLLTAIPDAINTELVKEKEEQYLAYKKLLNSISKRIKTEIQDIDNIYGEHFEKWTLSDVFKQVTVKKFLEKIGYPQVENAMYIALNKGLNSDDTLRYFCGICHNIIREHDRV